MPLLISSFLFAGIHVPRDTYQLVVLAGAGALLGYVYIVTRSVVFCVISHSIANALLYFAIQMQGTQ
jgi:membrane protease YdiL (CAAX protease family)